MSTSHTIKDENAQLVEIRSFEPRLRLMNLATQLQMLLGKVKERYTTIRPTDYPFGDDLRADGTTTLDLEGETA